MFDIGFTELLVVAVVALVVLGPERLPKAARFAGLWVRRARAQWYSVKSELEREIAAEELKRSLQETRDVARDIGRRTEEAMRDVDARVREAEAEARNEIESMRRQVLPAAAPDAAPEAVQDAVQQASPEAGADAVPRQPDLLHDAAGDRAAPPAREEDTDGPRR